MPIYMDRHDVSDTVTAEHVAQLHQEDLKIQHQFGCRGLTYWFDDQRKTAFCLIEAPDAAAIANMHNKAHGQVPNSIIEVDASIVESFLGRIGDPVKAKNTGLNIINDPAFRTIMVLEIKGPAHLPTGTAAWDSLFSHFTDAFVPVLKAYDGNVVKQTASSYLVSFRSVSYAVHAALDIRKLFKEFSRDMGVDGIILKIGMSAGVPVTRKQLIFEDAVKLAEWMCELVKGEIIISAEVNDLYQSENSRIFREGEGLCFLTASDEKFLTQLMDYIGSAWNNTGLKVDDFSRPLGYSKSQLYRKLISLTGKSPNTFIKEYRLKEALKLLSRNAGNISEIAFETGFSSPSYFSKCFQKRYGRMPSDYLPAMSN
ncbi:MAG TPA: nickel-binding protein [Puia sp.]|nr:nickel-binding protein [Puia sp.]